MVNVFYELYLENLSKYVAGLVIRTVRNDKIKFIITNKIRQEWTGRFFKGNGFFTGIDCSQDLPRPEINK